MGWTKRTAAVTIRLMSVEQREAMAQRVATLMDAQGLTNEALAFKAGVASKTVSRILNAKHESRTGTIEKIAKALDIEEYELRGRPAYARHSDGTAPDLSLPGAQLDRIEAAIASLDAKLSAVLLQLEAPGLEAQPQSAEEPETAAAPLRRQRR